MALYPIVYKKWMKLLFPQLTWTIEDEQSVVLSFDDGPHPRITPEVLELLDLYKSKAIFFLVGEQAEQYPDLVNEIKKRGHQIGGHTYHHQNQWKTNNSKYLSEVEKTQSLLKTVLFRPPYGKITPSMSNKLLATDYVDKIIMWSILSGDFDRKLSPQKCFENIEKNLQGGDILLFHDSEKAYPNMIYSLQKTLDLLEARNLKTKLIDL